MDVQSVLYKIVLSVCAYVCAGIFQTTERICKILFAVGRFECRHCQKNAGFL